MRPKLCVLFSSKDMFHLNNPSWLLRCDYYVFICAQSVNFMANPYASNCVHCNCIYSKYRFVPWPPFPPVTVKPLQINSLFFIPLHRKLHAGRWAWKWILISRMSLFSKYKNISFVIYTLGWDTVQKKSNMHLHPLSTLPSSQPQKKTCTHGPPFGGSQVDKVVVLRLGCTR